MKVGLSRKALRIYEERGLLKPVMVADSRVGYYDEASVTRGRLIKLLRAADISVANITCLFVSNEQEQSEAVSSISRAITQKIKASEKAIRTLCAFKRHSPLRPKTIVHGGYWVQGHETLLKKQDVAGYVTEFARRLAREKVPNEIIARYSKESGSEVFLGCYVKDEDKKRGLLSSDLRRYFIPTRKRYALKAIGVYGDYDCFKNAYDALSHYRRSETTEIHDSSSIEIYENYPFRSKLGTNFKALILV